ncbi:hypothetical protein WJX72_008942 [[Myrmecia] bisecta]|uniref:Plastid lipid-associated protein/fibrillin conserved domain-containing protein n=1 Tax=[Myrmecia] bisecta TaxID=41462 RepID=A0AAW1PU80_9CHLO
MQTVLDPRCVKPSIPLCSQARLPREPTRQSNKCGVTSFQQKGPGAKPSQPDTTLIARAQASVAQPPAPSDEDEIPLEDLKAQLLDSLFGIERGLTASSELRAEINELLTQLEARNPTPSPNEAAEKLNGRWKLVYTANSELMALLALSKLPFVTVGDITQRIDSATLTVENKVALSVPFSRTSFSTNASFEVRSPKRLQVKFEQGVVETPELLQDIEFPASISILGQSIDLTNLRDALSPVNEQVKSAVSQLSGFISQQPDLSFPISVQQAQTWLINTYLDEDTRVSRGDGGSVFIMVKDVSITPSVNVLIEPTY